MKLLVLLAITSISLCLTPEEIRGFDRNPDGIIIIHRFNIDKVMDYVKERNASLLMHLYAPNHAPSLLFEK